MEFIRRGLAEVKLFSKLNTSLPTFSGRRGWPQRNAEIETLWEQAWGFSYLSPNHSSGAQQEKWEAWGPAWTHSEFREGQQSPQKSRAPNYKLISPLSHKIQPLLGHLTKMQIYWHWKKCSSQGSTKLNKWCLSTTEWAITNSKTSPHPSAATWVSLDLLGWAEFVVCRQNHLRQGRFPHQTPHRLANHCLCHSFLGFRMKPPPG